MEIKLNLQGPQLYTRGRLALRFGATSVFSLFFFEPLPFLPPPPFLTINGSGVLSIPEFLRTLWLTAESLDTFYSFPKG